MGDGGDLRDIFPEGLEKFEACRDSRLNSEAETLTSFSNVALQKSDPRSRDLEIRARHITPIPYFVQPQRAGNRPRRMILFFHDVDGVVSAFLQF